MFVAMHVSGINAIFPRIMSDLGASVAAGQWILTAYTLSLCACLLTFGNLADRIGLRRVFIWGVALFGISSGACALAPSAPWLIALRALQGLAAAMVSATSIALAADSVKEIKMGWGIGCQTCMTCIGLAFGPLLAGFITQRFGWRMLFAVNLPASAIAFWVALMGPDTEPSRRASSIPARPFRVTGRWFAAAANEALYYLCLYAMGFLIPLYLIRGQGFTTAQIGTFLFIQGAARAVLAPISGRVTDRFGASLPIWLGIVSLALSACFFGLFGSGLFGNQATPVAICSALILLGAGAGLFAPANSKAMLSASPAGKYGTAAGVISTARNLGMTLGVALGSVLYVGFGGDGNTFYTVREAFRVMAGIAIVYAVVSIPLRAGESKQRWWLIAQTERS
jgi:MFS family permease